MQKRKLGNSNLELANHRLAIAFWYFCSHWDAPLSVGLEQKSKQINQPIAILFEFPTWAVQIPDFFKDTAGEWWVKPLTP